MTPRYRPTVVEVDLEAIRYNVRLLKPEGWTRAPAGTRIRPSEKGGRAKVRQHRGPA